MSQQEQALDPIVLTDLGPLHIVRPLLPERPFYSKGTIDL